MKPVFHHGDCLEVLPTLDANSVDSVVTDPPYGIAFMSQNWDHGVPGPQFWKEILRVAKPGAFLLAFGGTRTFHRLTCAIEDAGWELKDCIMWVYGSGFPKSLNVSKAIDKESGFEPKVIGKAADFSRDGSSRKTDGSHVKPHCEQGGHGYGDRWSAPVTEATTDEAKKWSGWGTCLKPAWEPIIVARKPLDGTVAQNVLKHGTGGMNIDGCRVPLNGDYKCGSNGRPSLTGLSDNYDSSKANQHKEEGRWPANLIHDGSDEVVGLFPETTSGMLSPENNVKASTGWSGGSYPDRVKSTFPPNFGSAARFFYCAKASRADRNEGLDDPGPQFKHGSTLRKIENTETKGNNHPTVKPTMLMRYLCRLVTSEGGVVLDPFMGSGSTGKAAMAEGFGFIGIEKEAEYVEIARKRVKEDPFS